MKFISKSSNLLIVLRPGLSAQPLTGTPAKATISVRFKDGVAEVQQQELIDMMLAHPGFNGDFISAEGIPADPYATSRQSSEPAHILTEMKFGTPMSKTIKGGNPLSSFSPEIQKMMQEMATKMAQSMLPSMVENTLKEIVGQHKEEKDAEIVEKDEDLLKEEVEAEVPEKVVETKPKTTPSKAKSAAAVKE